jgi:hypothetical protein
LLETQSHVGEVSPTLDYIILVVKDRDVLSQVLVIGHGDVTDTSEGGKERAVVTMYLE